MFEVPLSWLAVAPFEMCPIGQSHWGPSVHTSQSLIWAWVILWLHAKACPVALALAPWLSSALSSWDTLVLDRACCRLVLSNLFIRCVDESMSQEFHTGDCLLIYVPLWTLSKRVDDERWTEGSCPSAPIQRPFRKALSLSSELRLVQPEVDQRPLGWLRSEPTAQGDSSHYRTGMESNEYARLVHIIGVDGWNCWSGVWKLC